MRLLIIGGSSFLGRAFAQEALARGHVVTTFNRGVSSPDVEGVEALRGDRSDPASLAQLADREWDAVVDTCGYVPRVVLASAELLAGRVPAYAYVSSISAYSQWPAQRPDESMPTHECAPDAGPDDGDYGVLKAGCERAVQQAYAGGALVIRPGLILGPFENVGRLPAWLLRMQRGGRVLAPGKSDQPMQLVDARDIATFTLDGLERGLTGFFNVTGPVGNATFGSWLEDCRAVTGSDAELVWVDDAFLLESGVEPWSELPLWSPMDGESEHLWDSSTDAAQREGLTCRPVRDTVADTWAWLSMSGPAPQRPDRPQHGIDPDKEQRILAAWDARS
jgi:2'-hydroxyisoflavone reductase